MNKLLAIVLVLFSSNHVSSQEPRYRFLLPPRPYQSPALNNTIQPQLANQNINFNTNNTINIFGMNGGFNNSSGGTQGTLQYTQNNTPGMRISQLYQLPISNNNTLNNFNMGFRNSSTMQFATNSQPIGFDNPYYQMAMQGILSGVGGLTFQNNNIYLGSQFGQLGNNQFNRNQYPFGQFGNFQLNGNQNSFGQFGIGFNNGL